MRHQSPQHLVLGLTRFQGHKHHRRRVLVRLGGDLPHIVAANSSGAKKCDPRHPTQNPNYFKQPDRLRCLCSRDTGKAGASGVFDADLRSFLPSRPRRGPAPNGALRFSRQRSQGSLQQKKEPSGRTLCLNCFSHCTLHLLRLANIQQAQLPIKGCCEKHGLLGWMPPSLPRR